ncbi:MAG TPA: protein-disulfide reductase DsbD N-terminal domain-containing protein [Pyrinomonadaceae bacterium]|nr:protein-disulfide reductase DsbD N-terminal domain-containing protein [Pyrinomonadaceae bacterium]
MNRLKGRRALLQILVSFVIAVAVNSPSQFIAASGLRASGVFQSPPNIQVNGYTSTDKVQRGRAIQGAIVMDIPGGYHVNSNRPLEKFLVATQLSVEAPQGVKVGAVAFPRALLKNFQFSKEKLSVYEGRVILRFNVTVPASFNSGSIQLKSKLRYQSCSDSLCFPPQTREVKLDVPVVGANESVKRVNSQYFSGRR